MLKYLNINSLVKENSMLINRAPLKYGHSSFSLDVLEYCVKAETLTRENYYIDYLKPYYNIAKDSKAPMLGRKHTIETLKKWV